MTFLKFYKSKQYVNEKQGKLGYAYILISTSVWVWEDAHQTHLYTWSLCLPVDEPHLLIILYVKGKVDLITAIGPASASLCGKVSVSFSPSLIPLWSHWSSFSTLNHPHHFFIRVIWQGYSFFQQQPFSCTCKGTLLFLMLSSWITGIILCVRAPCYPLS